MDNFTALVGTANVLQSVAFIAEHERSTHVKYFVIGDDKPHVSDKVKFIGRDQIADAVRDMDMVFMLTDLNDVATCETAHLISDCVKNENIFLSVVIVQSASNEFSGEMSRLQQNFGLLVNLEEQPNNQSVEEFSYKIVHGIHSVYDEEFYSYLMPIDGTYFLELLTVGRKSFVSFGEASGENAVIAAINTAIDSPLIKKSLQEAQSVFLNVLGCDSLSMLEVNEASTTVQEAVSPGAEFYWVVNLDETIGEKIFVMIFVRV